MAKTSASNNEELIQYFKTESYWERLSRMQKEPETPIEVFAAAMDYFKWADENPLIKHIPIQSGRQAGKQIQQLTPRPYSLRGFCVWTGFDEDLFRMWREIDDKTDPKYIVAMKIIQLVFLQNYEATLAGYYNPNFIKDALQSADENTRVKIEIVNGIPELANSEIEVLESIKIKKGEIEIPKGKIT